MEETIKSILVEVILFTSLAGIILLFVKRKAKRLEEEERED